MEKKRERERACTCRFISQMSSTGETNLGPYWDKGAELGASSGVQPVHMHHRDPNTCAISDCLPESALEENWSNLSDPGNLMWDVSILLPKCPFLFSRNPRKDLDG